MRCHCSYLLDLYSTHLPATRVLRYMHFLYHQLGLSSKYLTWSVLMFWAGKLRISRTGRNSPNFCSFPLRPRAEPRPREIAPSLLSLASIPPFCQPPSCNCSTDFLRWKKRKRTLILFTKSPLLNPGLSFLLTLVYLGLEAEVYLWAVSSILRCAC